MMRDMQNRHLARRSYRLEQFMHLQPRLIIQRRKRLIQQQNPRPGILLLDEPLSALDDQTRNEMHELLKAVRSATEVTVLHITHHVADAENLADQVLVLENGKVRDGSMEELRVRV